MFCPNCQSENPPGKKFCLQCGTALNGRCPRCGAENPPSSRFCGDCGAALDTGLPAEGPPATPAAPSVRITPEGSAVAALDGERKTVTALFADIKGSTEMMEDLDPEKARAIIDPALALMMDAVHRYDGYVVQSTGDGIFALFGAPASHEDHPQRALYAALRLREDLRRYSAKVVADGGTPIQCRIGVNTGEVVVRSIHTGAGHVEYTPIGHTTNLASRMQTAAPVGSIAVTEATRKLCEGYFTLTPLGATKIKGVSEPVDVYEVIGIGALRTRLQVAAQRGLTRFVGRDAELAQMRLALESAREGHGQIVAAIGEPGVGKSRLFFEFKAVAQSGCLMLEAYSVSHGKASAYLPVMDLLRDYLRFTPDDDPRRRREKVIGKVLGLDRSLEDTLPYVFALMGIQEGEDPLAQMDAQIRRRRTHEALKRILLRESLNRPLIMVFEDLHWIDSETQALLNLMADSIANARILLLVNYRPEYRHEWGSRTHYTQLRLDPLSKENAQEMLAALLDSGRPLSDQGEGGGVGIAALKRFIIKRTEGNPFFMEEMIQALFEQGVLLRDGVVTLAKELKEIRIPPTVQAILASRIDRLPAPEKELLQTLAVLGREFSSGLIKRVTGNADNELERMLSELQLAEFIYEQPAFPDIEYTFKHALTQEVAYNSMLSERRKALHERVGVAIETLFSEHLDDRYSDLAHHYRRAGNSPKAVMYLRLAAEQAAARSAMNEACALLGDAINLLRTLPEAPDRDRQELELQVLFASLLIARGFAIQERGETLQRAYQLCAQVGDQAQLASILFHLCQYNIGLGRFSAARELAQRALPVAEGARDPILICGAYHNLGEVCFWTGLFTQAVAFFNQALDLCAKVPAPTLISAYGFDLWVGTSGERALAQVLMGQPEQASRTARELLDRAQESSHRYTCAFGMQLAAFVSVLRHEAHTARELSAAIMSLGEENGFTELIEMAHVPHGWARFRIGGEQEGITEMESGLADVARYETVNGSTSTLATIADARLHAGDARTALDRIERGLRTALESGERFYEAELLRLKGESILALGGDPVEAETYLRNAIEIATAQSARWWELRAARSLAGLLAGHGRREEARAILSGIYNWFTEGFDTADLKDAKALLDELTH